MFDVCVYVCVCIALTVDTKIGSAELKVMRRSQPSEPNEVKVNGTCAACC